MASSPQSSVTLAEQSISSVQLKVGLEIHIELATRSKMFSRVASGAHGSSLDAAPNTLIDPLTLGLPGALPVLNARAVDLSLMVGLALGCKVGGIARWDRKGYFYPDMPKNYQISQYAEPLCGAGAVTIHAPEPVVIRITRAHLEEDAGKLLHETPGATAAPDDSSLADYNRAGTPLLEVVTEPDFTTADQVVAFAQMLRSVCRHLGATEGIMQRGHMRFEPNINCILTLSDKTVVKTPIVEVKNLNSFRSLRGAIEYELAHQPLRWQTDRLTMRPGSKTTRGWDDVKKQTFVQREKEEAADYRYFPDPDLLPLDITPGHLERLRQAMPELPVARRERYIGLGVPPADAELLVDEPGTCALFDGALETAAGLLPGAERLRLARLTANLLLQSGAKRANEATAARASAARERGAAESGGDGDGQEGYGMNGDVSTVRPVLIAELGITAAALGQLVALREGGQVNSNATDELFGLLCGSLPEGVTVAQFASDRGLLLVKDDGAIKGWCEAAIAEQPQAAADVRAGKQQAIGRLVGAAMKHAKGSGDAAVIRTVLLEMLGGGAG